MKQALETNMKTLQALSAQIGSVEAFLQRREEGEAPHIGGNN